jgi:hypothetical protein
MAIGTEDTVCGRRLKVLLNIEGGPPEFLQQSLIAFAYGCHVYATLGLVDVAEGYSQAFSRQGLSAPVCPLDHTHPLAVKVILETQGSNFLDRVVQTVQVNVVEDRIGRRRMILVGQDKGGAGD